MTTLADVTAAALKTRYPAFAGVADPTVTAILDEARGSVDDTWIEKDQVPAVLALTAHLLIGAGALGGSGEEGYTVTGIPIAGLRAADHEIRFVNGHGTKAAAVSGASALGGYSTTAYGQRFLQLRARSFPAVMVV